MPERPTLAARVRAALEHAVSPVEICDAFCAAVCEAVGPQARTYVYADAGDRLWLQAQRGWRHAIASIGLDEGLTGAARTGGVTVFAADVRDDPRWLQAGEGIVSAVVVPFTALDLQGAAGLETAGSALDPAGARRFEAAVAELGRALAGLGRRRLAAATGSSLHRTFLRIGAQRDPVTLLDLTAQAVGELLPADSVHVAEQLNGGLVPGTTWGRDARSSAGNAPDLAELHAVRSAFPTVAGMTTAADAPAVVGIPLRAASQDVGYLVARAATVDDEIPWRRIVDAELVCAHAASVLFALRTQERLALEAAQDPLTGLWNHRRFQADVARLRGRPHVLILCDLDDFKLINDLHGHAAGDDALRAVARVLLQVSRDGDLAYRLGGEEFALLLPRASVLTGRAVAERVQQELRRIAPVAGLTLSCGVAGHPADGADARTLLEAADRALYTSKRLGKDRVTAAAGDVEAPAARPLELPSGEEAGLLDRARADARSAAALLELAARLQDCAAIEDLGAAVSDALLTHVSADRVSFWATAGDGLTRLVASAGVDASRLLASRPQAYRPSPAAPDVAALLRGDVWHSAGVADEDWEEGLPPLPATSSLMQVPILEDGTLRASISLTRVDGSPFSARDVSIARAFATQSALALRSWAARDEAERTIVATVEALVEALAAKDQYTSDHGLEVQHLTVETGVALGLDEEALAHLSQAAVLHDIGKIGVPLEVLHKPAALDETELALIRQHPILGERILAPVARLRAVIPLVRWSHERWDGDGYPDGLRAEEIPLGARIIAVVDAYSAMTTDRPYRAALPQAEARRELLEGAGTQFDAAVVRAFLRVMDGAYTTAAGTP